MSLDIQTVSRIFPEVKISNSSGHTEYVVHCRKFHRKGGKYKLSINANTGVFMCNDCGWCGNAFNEFFDEGNQFFSGLMIHRPTVEAAVSNRVTYQKNTEEWSDGIPKPGSMIDISELEKKHPAISYLEKRGISIELCDTFNIKYCKNGFYDFSSRLGTTSGRIIFPIYMSKKLVGWQARQIEKKDGAQKFIWKGEKIGWWKPHKIILSDGTKTCADYEVPKYYTCPGMHRSKSLFNFDSAIKNTEYVVVVEGPIDCMKVGKSCVATFGKKITRDQIRILKSNWSKIILLLDSEVDTNEEWFKMLENSFDGVYFRYMKLSGYDDPGDAPTEEIWKQIKQKTKK